MLDLGNDYQQLLKIIRWKVSGELQHGRLTDNWVPAPYVTETRPGASSRVETGNTHHLGHLSFPPTHCPPLWACKNKRKEGMWIEPLHYQRTSAQEGYVLTPRRRAISKRRKREKLRGNMTSTRHAQGTRPLLQRQNNQTHCINPTV